MPATASVGSQGNPYINGILTGTKWATSSLTYSFPSSASYYGSGYGSGEPNNNFQAFNAAQQAAVKSVYAMYSSVANVTFTEVTETSTQHADLRFAETDKYTTAFGYYPSTSAEGGDAWFGNSSNYFNNPVKGNYAYFTTIHEIGHTLGLKHAHESMGSFGPMPSDRNSTEYTVMSYRSYIGASTAYYTNGGWSYPQTLMMYDIAAVQALYGANYNTNNGDSVYQWDPNTGELFVNGTGQGAPGSNQVYMTVWDGGGSDTYDFSNYQTSVTVSLEPGEWTTTSSQQLANLGNGHFASGNVANALLYQSNLTSLIENVIGGSGNDVLEGNVANNVFRGGGGNDLIDGRGGSDTAVYSGNEADYHYEQHADGTWTVADLRNGSPDGVDTLKNIRYLKFADATVDFGPIMTVIAGTNANDMIDATHTVAGQLTPTDELDTVYGMAGNDTIDALGGDDLIYGGDGSDTLYGGAGNDLVDGGSGSDKMYGGLGDDTYVVDNKEDVASEANGDGTDTVLSSISFSLADSKHAIGSIENLTLTGSGNINATGNALDNILIGNSGNNVLTGGWGGDTLDGGDGSDTASYATSGLGVAVSLALGVGSGGDAEGDRLSNIENLTGSNYDDTLEGDGGDNKLVGGKGIDTVSYAHADSGADGQGVTVNIGTTKAQNTLTAGTDALSGFENLTGSQFNDTLIGSRGNNVLSGLAGDDWLDGSRGADHMFGGAGHDSYVVDNAGDVVDETNGDGIDTVYSSRSFSLADPLHAIGSIENLTLTGKSGISGTGNDLDNTLIGNSNANVLIGGAGADWLDGGGGTDTASYATSALGVTVSLALGPGSGGDAQGDTLTNIENLTGSDSDDTLEGNAGNNKLVGGLGIDTVSYAHAASGDNGLGVTVNLASTKSQNTVTAGKDTLSGFENLTGSEFNDTLRGSSGNNIITGLAGNDKLTGAGGDDTFVFLPGFGNDTITDFTAGPNSGPHDVIAIDHTIFADFDAVMAASTQVGSSTVITADAQNAITLANVSVGSLHHDDLQRSPKQASDFRPIVARRQGAGPLDRV